MLTIEEEWRLIEERSLTCPYLRQAVYLTRTGVSRELALMHIVRLLSQDREKLVDELVEVRSTQQTAYLLPPDKEYT